MTLGYINNQSYGESGNKTKQNKNVVFNFKKFMSQEIL